MSLKDALYQHLKTFRKYKTLELKYDTKREELEDKINELLLEKRIRAIERKNFEGTLKDYVDNITRLTEENKKLKKEVRELKRGGSNNGKNIK